MKYVRTKATLALDESVQQVKQISPARERTLNNIGISTIRDLLYHFPFRYIDMSRVETAASAIINETCTIVGSVHEITLKKPRPRLNLVEVALVDASGILIVTFFRQPWLMEKIKVGDRIAVAGKIEFNYGYKRMTNPFFEVLDDSIDEVEGTVIPVHHSSEKLSATWMRRLIGNAIEQCAGVLDPLPLDIRSKYRLASRQNAIRSIHFPHSIEDAQQARRRLAYEEVFMLELHLMQSAKRRSEGKHPTAHVINGSIQQALQKNMPFELTSEQEVAKNDLLCELSKDHCASHMILGDVGTGKTILAAFGIAAAADSGTQVAMMAPTEVLAQQYGRKLGPILDSIGIQWALLTGSTTQSDRAPILEDLKTGALTVLFGTQALLEDSVVFKQCSLAVIDEQQRFGVNQRAKLLEKGEAPDALYLTATPIPRTMALALYGDLTLSYLKTRPTNTVGNTTKVYDKQNEGYAYEAATEALKAGRQVYVVCPLVGARTKSQDEDDQKIDHQNDPETESVMIDIDDDQYFEGNIKAATSEAEYLQKKIFPNHKVALLHGKLASDEKQTIMNEFHEGAIDVLVSTTAIEVGVDVPNATVMIIEDADRFGLAQLHQLRGRVGRGSIPGEIFLISGTRAPVALERLSAMERIDDGFELATYDLSLRKEGDLLGNKQHGASTLKLINVVRDGAIIEAAHKDALELLERDEFLEDDSHLALGRELRILFKEDQEALGG